MKRKHKTKQENKTKIWFLVFSWVVLSAIQIFLWGTDWLTQMEWLANISNKTNFIQKKRIMQIWEIFPRLTDVRLTAAQNMQIQTAV